MFAEKMFENADRHIRWRKDAKTIGILLDLKDPAKNCIWKWHLVKLFAAYFANIID